MKIIYSYRFLILRRIVQLLILVLFAGANYFGWSILKGNYSSGVLFDTIPLSDPFAVTQILATGFIAGADVLIGVGVVLLLYGVLFGRMFCSWVCPMNIVTDTANFAGKKLKISTKLLLNRKIRYFIILLGLVVSFIIGIPAFEAVSPVAMLHRGIIFSMGASWTIIVALFLFDFAVSKNAWCGHICPIGAFYAIIGKFSLLKVKHTVENCTNCQDCFEVCPEKQVLDIINIESGFIHSSECTNCMRCIEKCEDKALKLSIRNPLQVKMKKH